jgi:hypothetical protein
MKISGFMIIKNEWPLAAVSISHALIHTLDKIYVVDNGSSDGTWKGLKILQEIFPDRIFPVYYESSVFNQKAIHHALSHLVPRDDDDHWGIFLDADEFTVWSNSLPFREFLKTVNLNWGALIVDLENYIPHIDFSDCDLRSYGEIKFQARSLYQFAYERKEFIEKANAKEIYWQNFRTLSKVILRDMFWKRLGYGGHQVEYGDGKHLSAHDSMTAYGSKNYGLFRAHLPYTSLARLQNRATFNYSAELANSSNIFTGTNAEDLEKVFSNMVLDQNSLLFSNAIDSQSIYIDNNFSQSFEAVISILESSWQEIVSAHKVVAEPSEINFSVLVDMAAQYIDLLDLQWSSRVQKGQH